MTDLYLGIAAFLLLALAAPAAAQYAPNHQNHYSNGANASFSVRIDQLRARLQAGVQNGSITRRQAAPIREQVRQRPAWNASTASTASPVRKADLQQRVRMVRQQLRVADNGGNGRYAQWDVEAGHNPNYQLRYSQGYQQPVQQGGIAGALSQVLGVGGLQVGQRVSGKVYAVPQQHENHYRDGNGVYYRSNGRRIYQVDERSQTVVRVFPI
jgi:hypothetical protein